MKRVLTFLLAVMAAAGTISAKITLPEIIGDNMVLQQDTKVRIWGKASAGKTVTITTSWSREKTKVTADGDGTGLPWYRHRLQVIPGTQWSYPTVKP